MVCDHPLITFGIWLGMTLRVVPRIRSRLDGLLPLLRGPECGSGAHVDRMLHTRLK